MDWVGNDQAQDKIRHWVLRIRNWSRNYAETKFVGCHTSHELIVISNKNEIRRKGVSLSRHERLACPRRAYAICPYIKSERNCLKLN